MRKLTVGALAFGMMGIVAQAQAGEAAFCLDYADKQCANPLKDGDQIKLGALGVKAGQPVLHFASTQPAAAGQTLYHHWEVAEKVRGGKSACAAKPWLGAAPAASAQAALEAQKLGEDLCKTVFGFNVQVGGANYHLNSWRTIHGPGVVAAQALDAQGSPVPGTTVRVEIVE